MCDGQKCFAAIEVKTMTSVKTIREAMSVASTYADVIIINNIGSSEEANELFKRSILSTDYRAQCIHHAPTLQTNTVLYVVSKGARSGKGEIFYFCIFEFNQQFIFNYMFYLNTVRSFAFSWLAYSSSSNPSECEKLRMESYAGELQSFQRYFTLRKAILNAIDIRGSPFPHKNDKANFSCFLELFERRRG